MATEKKFALIAKNEIHFAAPAKGQPPVVVKTGAYFEATAAERDDLVRMNCVRAATAEEIARNTPVAPSEKPATPPKSKTAAEKGGASSGADDTDGLG